MFIDFLDAVSHRTWLHFCDGSTRLYCTAVYSEYLLAMNDRSTLQLREYDSLSGLYSAIPKTIGSSLFSQGQEFLWTCVDVCEKYIAVGTSVGQLFLYDRSRGVICHQLSSPVCYFILLLSCLCVIFLLLLFIDCCILK